ncbi:hypothetical protein [Neokomagataea thailandica]|uniref:hypothetical protein n=1 Tax=Neokomagataea TaxID=1223423 RepID=UPI001FDFDCFF|nr:MULTISPECIES: hypothetical protein [Neokomagataea]
MKKAPDRAPQRVTDADVEDIARASIEALHQRVVGDGWGRLEILTQGWLVQRQKGQKPSALGEEDFRAFTLIVLHGLSAPRGITPVAAHGVEGDEPAEVTAQDGEAEDMFRFAREHLARAL